MNPLAMGLLLLAASGGFAFSLRRRWRLMMIGPTGPRINRIAQRLRFTLRHAFGQPRLTRYRLAGFAHKAIFLGFMVLLLRAVILFGRGFIDDPNFGFWIFDRGTILGNLYALVKDFYVLLVILGTVVFLTYRLAVKLPRMTLRPQGIMILAMILIIMFADITYDGAGLVLATQAASPTAVTHATFNPWEPLGSLLAAALQHLSAPAPSVLWHVSFWTHVGVMLIFLNTLPYSKHFHIITAIPNVLFHDLAPPGRLHPIDDLEAKVERGETLGIRRINEFTWKGILDLYSCTECGRCSDHCPALHTGKLLSPKQFTIDLRDSLYANESALIADAKKSGDDIDESSPPHVDLVPGVIKPEVLWACTTCGACEQECPVFISYVDKIVDMRRYLVQEKGECPSSLQEAFASMEAAGSPYGVSCDERMTWATGLDVPLRANIDEPEILFWVGCAPAADARAKAIARAVAQLLNLAGVIWAVLGPEERCTGDIARRAGNEFLFQTMAGANIEMLNGYGTKKILTACPHCYNKLKNEYPDFGGHYDVVHHSEFLAQLVVDGRLRPKHRVNARIAFHDSCYLGRLNDLYDSPRAVLASIPGVQLVEPTATRDRGTCCGAGGAQMFKEDEPGRERISVARTRQLLQTGADTVSSACPFCMRMLTDALTSMDHTDIEQLDIAEVLLRSVGEECVVRPPAEAGSARAQ